MNGVGGANSLDEAGKPEGNTQILHALEIIHNPRSPNETRHNASRYLEEIRSDEEAPYHGFGLASAKQHPAIVRHYGLSLLEYAVRHKWSDYTPEQSRALRDWVVALALNVSSEDPPYITNKVAEIWVEVAKRSWGLEWMDMDELLVRLWDGPSAHRLLVLTILETLSEDVCGTDDSAAALRGNELNRACVDIFTPADVLAEYFPSREISINTRYGSEGWSARTAALLEWCISDSDVSQDQQVSAVKALATFKSIITWIIPGALVTTKAVNTICACLAVSNMPIQLVSMSFESWR
jgi:exportin-5